MVGGEFGGEVSPDEEAAAAAEYFERKEAHGIPCPRLDPHVPPVQLKS